MFCRNRPNVISNDLKCAGGWGSAPGPAGGAYDAPPDPLIVRGNAPSALGTLYFVSIFTSQFPFRAPLTEFLDPPLSSADPLDPLAESLDPPLLQLCLHVLICEYAFKCIRTHYSFVRSEDSIAPLQGDYPGALPIPERLKKRVFR